MTWRDLFQEHILMRGRIYADSSHVRNLNITFEKISAVVEGSEYYHVSINLKNGSVKSAHCTCPYAAKGYMCKHMAAVLILAEEQSSNKPQPLTPLIEQAETDLKVLLEDAKKEDLVSMLMELSAEDEMLSNRLKVRFAKTITIGDMRELKSAVNSIFYQYGGRGGFIDYYHASDFTYDLYEFMKDNVKPLIDHAHFMEAFDLTRHIFVKLGKQDMDDSDGGSMLIAEKCYEYWKTILSECAEDEYSIIKSWFEENSCNGAVIDYMEEVLLEFLDKELASKEELQEEMAELDKLIEANRSSTECPSRYSIINGYESVIFRRIELMRILGANENDVDQYMSEHIHFTVIRDLYIDRARENQLTGAEITLLEDGCRLVENSHKQLSYKKRLAELYQQTGEIKKQKKILYDIYMNYSNSGTKEFCAYKALCSEKEWLTKRKKMIYIKADVPLRCKLLEEEELFEELFQTVMEQEDVSLINKYGFLFKETHPDKILAFYSKLVKELVKDARNRSRYEELTRYLDRMIQFDNGAEIVNNLARNWAETYQTRKLLVKELEKYIL